MMQVNVALLSYGMSGKVFHAPFVNLHPGLNLSGCWERTKQLIGADYPGTKSYAAIDDLLADPAVNLVIVNTPTYTHHEYAKKSLEAGKHTLVEKAFTTNVAEALELEALAESKGVKLAVFQNRRWDSDFQAVQSVVQQQLLGEIVEAQISYDRYNAALSHKIHKETKNAGSGVVKDLSPHLIDQALCLFGMPHHVFADLMITRPDSIVPDYFEIILYYEKHRVRLRAGYYVREPVPSYIFHGKLGSFLKTRSDVQEAKLLAGEKPSKDGWAEPDSESGFLHTEKDGKILKEKVKSPNGSYYKFFDGVYQALTSNAQMPVTAEDGVNVMRVIEAAEKSDRDKCVIRLD
jgi:predicted dehydrogenase